MKRLLPGLSVRSAMVLLGASGLALVITVTIVAVGGLGPKANGLGRDSKAIIEGLSLVEREDQRLSLAIAESRDALAHGAAAAASVDPQVWSGRSSAVAAAGMLSRIPAEMRIALAGAADSEAQVRAFLRACEHARAAGDAAMAARHLAAADTLHAVFADQVRRARQSGLLSLGRKQSALLDLTAGVQQLAPLWISLTALFAALMLLMLERRVQRPLERLDAALHAVAGGDLETILPVEREDEIGRLYGQFNRALGMLRESASARIRHEQSLRTRLERILAESAGEIYLVDAGSLRFLDANRQAAANLGYPLPELMLMSPVDIAAEGADTIIADVFAPLLDGRRAETLYLGRHARSNGTSYPVEVRYQAGLDHDPPLLLGFGRDLTGERLQEERIRQTQKLEAVGQLTGGVAHDFNNLLTVIQGNLELMSGSLEGEVAAAAAAALAAARRGADLTKQLLAFARQQPLAPRELDLNLMVADLLSMLKRTLGAGLEIRVESAAGLWTCLADPRQVENALLNLAINARDAMDGRGVLTITTANTTLEGTAAAHVPEVSPGEYVMIAVGDTGRGIPDELRARVFEPFFSTKPGGRGGGLGLAMVYGFVRQSGGHVALDSRPGEGTVVRLYLPRCVEVPAVACDDAAGAPADTVPLGRGALVLMVEDEPHVRDLVCRYLESLDYRVIAAEDAAAGLELLSRTPDVALVLSDVMLPGHRNGIDFADDARRQRPGLRALLMTGYADEDALRGAPATVVAELLHKPFTRAELARALARAARR